MNNDVRTTARKFVAATSREALRLVREALGNLGRDNVTVLVIDVHAVGDSRDTVEVETLTS